MQPVSAIALFCDDIREEKSGTVIIVGVLPDNAAVPSIPGTFPRLGVYVRIHLDPDFDPGTINVLMRGPGQRTEEVTTLDKDLIKKARKDAKAANIPIAGLIASLVAHNLPVQEPGKIEAIVMVGEEEYIAGVLNIRVKPQT